MGRLSGKVAIVTGAAGGQGAAEARLFAAEGAKVTLTDLSDEGEALAREIGGDTIFLRHDVSDKLAWDAVVAATLERFGRIDILVNNAGVYRPQSIQSTDEALFELHYRVNQLGVFLGMQAVVDPMKTAGGGAIVNTSSVAGLAGFPGMIAYATSKWAVRGLTKCAAADLGPFGIRVNSIHPGLIDTPMLTANNAEVNNALIAATPLGRMGTPEEVALLVAFLVSDEGRFITGSEVKIDGGIRL